MLRSWYERDLQSPVMCGDIDIWLSNMMPKLRTLSDGSMSSVPICKQTGGILHLLKDEVAMKNSVFESFNLSILFVIHMNNKTIITGKMRITFNFFLMLESKWWIVWIILWLSLTHTRKYTVPLWLALNLNFIPLWEWRWHNCTFYIR